jgi:hypothetical protein
MSSRRKLEEDLQESDEIHEQQKPVAPTKQEKNALSTYCSLALKIKQEEEATKKITKDVKPALKELRKDLLEDLRQQEVYQISQAARQKAIAKGLPDVPTYVRLTRNNKDLTITPEIVSEVLKGISDSDIMESKQDGGEALIDAIITGVRREVRSFTEQAKLMNATPRGVKVADIPVANKELCEKALELHEKNCFVLKAEREKRERIAQFKDELTSKEPSVHQYFERGGISSQRIVLENVPYNLCSREREKKTKITFKILQSSLEDGLKECILKKRVRPPTKQEIAACICDHKTELEAMITESLTSLPCEKSNKISLVRIKT